MKRLLFVVLLALTLSIPAAIAQDDNVRELVITVVASSDAFREWLEQHPGYTGNAWVEADTIWHVEFYNADGSEWLGYALIDSKTGAITESFIPLPLPADVYQRQLERLQPLVLDDPEVTALIQDPLLWDYSLDYNRWEQRWEAYFWRGVQAWQVNLYYDEDNQDFSIEDIFDPNILEAETAFRADRDRAIQIAYTADNVDQALNGYDNWTAYAENLSGALWSVSFVSDEQELFFAVIDLETDRVLETHTP